MIEEMSLMEPKELLYGKELVLELIRELPTDFYKDMNLMIFNSNILIYSLLINRVILEDRRIRMNAWVSSIISKPIDRLKIQNYLIKLLNLMNIKI